MTKPKRNSIERDGIKFTHLNREYIACSGIRFPNLKYNAISYKRADKCECGRDVSVENEYKKRVVAKEQN